MPEMQCIWAGPLEARPDIGPCNEYLMWMEMGGYHGSYVECVNHFSRVYDDPDMFEYRDHLIVAIFTVETES